jgi:hypothetical protein
MHEDRRQRALDLVRARAGARDLGLGGHSTRDRVE